MPEPANTESKISIQDIVIYGNKPTGYDKVLVLEEGEDLPNHYDTSLLILQRAGENLCVHEHINNRIETHTLPLKTKTLQHTLSLIAKLDKNKIIEIDKINGKKKPNAPIHTLINKIQTIYEFKPQPTPTGEFDDAIADIETQEERLYQNIENLVKLTAKKHTSANCDAKGLLRADKENNITRLITNEFSFYTKKPLSLKEFEKLNNSISTLASKQPENFHLILSSFAIKTPDNTIMNVVTHIECGKHPKINFIVKNHPSDIDPVYTETINGRRRILRNFDINKGDQPDIHTLNINGHSHTFSFDNVLECKTPGNNYFYSCIDICSDHARGVAKNNLITKLQSADKKKHLDSIHCTHIVTSNFIGAQKANVIAPITHADPMASHKACRQGELNTNQKKIKGTIFGTEQNITITPPMKCNALPESVLNQLDTTINLEHFIHRTLTSSTKNIKETASVLAAHLKEKNIEALNKIDIEALRSEYQSDLGAFNVQLLENKNPTLDNMANNTIPTLIKDNDKIWIYGNDDTGRPKLSELQLSVDDKKLLENLSYTHPPTILNASNIPNEIRNIVKKGHTHIKQDPKEQVNKILLDGFTNRANQISNIIASDILQASSKKHQIRIFKFYMAVMEQSYEIGDIETAITIGNGLTQQPIYRLDYLLTEKREALINQIQFMGRKKNKAAYMTYKEDMNLNKTVVIDSTPKFKFELAQLEGKPTAQKKAQGLNSIFEDLLPQREIYTRNPDALGKINFEEKSKNHITLDDNTLYKLSKDLYAKPKGQTGSPDFSRVPLYTSSLLTEKESHLEKINKKAGQAIQDINAWRRRIHPSFEEQDNNIDSLIPDETIHTTLSKYNDKSLAPEARLESILQGLDELMPSNKNAPEAKFLRAIKGAIIAQKNTTIDNSINIHYVTNNACIHCRHEGVPLPLIVELEYKYARHLKLLEHPKFFDPRKLAADLSDIPETEMALIVNNLSPEEKNYLSQHDPEKFKSIEKLEQLQVKTKKPISAIPITRKSHSPILSSQFHQSEKKKTNTNFIRAFTPSIKSKKNFLVTQKELSEQVNPALKTITSTAKNLNFTSILSAAESKKRLEGNQSLIHRIEPFQKENGSKQGVKINFKTGKTNNFIIGTAEETEENNIQFYVENTEQINDQKNAIKALCYLAVSEADENTIFNIPKSSHDPELQNYVQQCFEDAILEATADNKFENGTPSVINEGTRKNQLKR